MATLRSLRARLAFCLALALALVGPSCLSAAAGPRMSPQATKPPNVLVILVDQHHAAALSCTDNGFGGALGNPIAPLTPQIDRIAQGGMRFEAAYVAQAQCCPSRYSVLTGKYPSRHGLRWNLIWEPLDETTFPQIAREHGYVTGSFGKHHLYWLDHPAPRPTDHGFDVVGRFWDYVTFCQNSGSDIWIAASRRVALPGYQGELNPTGWTLNGNDFHIDGYFANRTLDFIEARAGANGDGKPFVCFYNPYGPHNPLLPTGVADPIDFAHLYDPFAIALPPNFGRIPTGGRLLYYQGLYSYLTEVAWRTALALYYGYIRQIDWNVGRILDRLEQLGIDDETIVVYTADHGEMGAEMSTWSKGAGNYDAVTRVPLLVRYPGLVPANTTSAELVSNIDLFPTLADMMGLTIEDHLRDDLDGRSWMPLFADPAEPNWRQEVFIEFGLTSLPGVSRAHAVRTKSHKLHVDYWGGPVNEELYDLTTDRWEQNDLAEAPTSATIAVLDDLRGRLDSWWNSVNGERPDYLTTGEGASRPAEAMVLAPHPKEEGVSRRATLRWLPSTSATRHLVHLGTERANIPLVAELGPMAGEYRPGTLLPGTQYWWRIDTVNGNGMRKGQFGTFQTAVGEPDTPGVAKAIAPLDGMREFAATTALTWVPAVGATQQVLHLEDARTGTAVTFTLGGAVTSFMPGLRSGWDYRWRVDGINAAGIYEGPWWRFSTDDSGVPERALDPQPALHAAQISSAGQQQLTWAPSAGATRYLVHFGSSFPLPRVGQTTAASFNVTNLQPGTRYYWRIDPVNSAGLRRGFTWSFSTQ